MLSKTVLIVFLTLVSSFSQLSATEKSYPFAMFSPQQGNEAFEEMYELVRNAREYAHISIYSWSDGNIDKAMLEALKNGARVRVVLHPPLTKKASVLSKVKKLEDAGAEVKIAKQNMHEKFILVDGKFLANTSANMSSGAKTKYSEAFVFHKLGGANDPQTSLIRDFRHEFTILWNSAKDMVTAGEENADALEDYTKVDNNNRVTNQPTENKNLVLYSSSMNFKIKNNKPGSSNYKTGKYITLSRRKDSTGEQTWTVRDTILAAIKNAKKNIFVNLNHFNIREVSDALIEAVERGVDVRLAVDNQEYKSRPNDKEMTPQFVQDWKELPGNEKREAPVRVKYYAHAPSPRHWLLNHHKYFVFDYTPSGEGTTLVAGSYNVSKNAEHRQFDNMVVYSGKQYQTLFKSFHDEFQNLWSLNRTEEDKPLAEVYNKFFEKNGDSFSLHMKEAISLSWSEVGKLRRDVGRAAKGIFSQLWKKKDCLFYNPVRQEYWACPK